MLRILVALAALAAIVVPASSAQASTVTVVDGRIHVTAEAGEENHVTINRWDPAWMVGVQDTAGLEHSSACWPFGGPPAHIQCPGGSPVVELDDLDDVLLYNDAETDMSVGPALVDGGSGDDDITTAYADDVVDGGPGVDTLRGYVGNDTLRGGTDGDTLDGFFGTDTLEGGTGADKLSGGMDNDTLRGGDGADRLEGNEHDDLIVGGAGADTIICGDGVDTVQGDPSDTIAKDCEKVSGATKPAPAAPVGRDTRGSESAPAPSPVVTPAPVVTVPRAVTPASRDRRAPKLAVKRRGRTLTLTCDEACTVTIKAGSKTLVRRLAAGKAVRVRVPGAARKVTLSAKDAAGNLKRTTRVLAEAAR